MTSINVLGTDYKVFKLKKDQDKRLFKVDGFCDHHAKEIVILDCSEYENEDDAMHNLEDYEYKVLRHEIIHAFLYESGLDVNSHDPKQWACDEEVVDWIAIQFPKINKIFDELNIL